MMAMGSVCLCTLLLALPTNSLNVFSMGATFPSSRVIDLTNPGNTRMTSNME